MYYFYLDASAWGKRYVTEAGTHLISRLLDTVPKKQIFASILAIGELVSILIRKKNSRLISETIYLKSISAFYADVTEKSAIILQSVPDDQVWASLSFIQQYSINATDAIILRSALNIADTLRVLSHDLVFVTSDIRLANSAQSSKLVVWNPEKDDQSSLEKLISIQ